MAKLIYIISTGHSGSTLLDILLGSFPKIFSTGEFKYFTWQLYRTQKGVGSVKKQDVCTCGKRFQKCSFWTKVIDKIDTRNYHMVAGNPMRYTGKIKVKYDDKWKRELSNKHKEAIEYYIKKYNLS